MSTEAAPLARDGAERVVLCYGDSNTWGYVPGSGERYAAAVRWPGVAAAELGGGYRLIENGLNSRTTVLDDPYAPCRNGLTLLQPTLETYAPLDAVVLFLGCNDLKGRFALSPHDIELGVEKLVTTIRRQEGVARTADRFVEVVIVAPPPMGPFRDFALLFEGAVEKSRALTARLRALAQRSGCGFVAAGEHLKVSPLDGVHFSAEGHRTLGMAVAAALRDRLE